jgi:hypothetical protein
LVVARFLAVTSSIMAFSLRALAAGCLAAGVAVGSGGCLFPDYTFDETQPAGGNGNGGSGAGTTTMQGAGGSGGTPETIGGMGTGGMGGNPPDEDCFTPGDEDGDGMADCADTDCEPDVECVDAIPVGWGTFGYVSLFRGSPLSDPACPTGALLAVHSGNDNLQNATAQCSACGCGAPVWNGCELTDFNPGAGGTQGIRARDVSCATLNATNLDDLSVPAGWDGSCNGPDFAPGGGTCPGGSCNQSVQAQLARPSNGTCQPTGGAVSGGDPSWGEGVKACKAESGLEGCSGSQVCVPRPEAPFEPRACIAKAGDNACPAGAFSLKSVSYGDFDDTRDCSDCSCGSAVNGTCKLTVSLFSDAALNSCNNPLAMVESGECVDLPSNSRVGSRTAAITQAPAGGSCSVTGGGVASGGVTPIDPTTFCCLPSD